MCYDLSEIDVNEDQCTGAYYSEEALKEIDEYPYAENCRDVNGLYIVKEAMFIVLFKI